MNSKKSNEPIDQWSSLAGDGDGKSRWIDPPEAMRALDALAQLHAKPGLLVLDDLTGFAHGELLGEWEKRIHPLKEFFDLSCPVLPVHKRHAEKGKTSDDLLPIVRDEIRRLRRPLAAVVDMQWQFCDTPEGDKIGKEPWFGLELIRLIKRAKPSLPIFVWSPIQDKHVMQRAMQLGASSCFDKPAALRFNHDLPANWEPVTSNELDAGRLWFRLLEWELARYHCPPVGVGDGDFILAESPDTVACKKRFLKDFGLKESDLRANPEPPVERLLRALVPDAVGVEILRFFGEGQSGLERPFVVRGRTATGRWLRPVQIKLSRDWRALSREGKGYRDVFAGCLGPSVAHVLTGPYRLGDWCGMAQSFAAPEEAIRDISSKSTRSLESWLRKKLPDADQCRTLVDEVFDGVLDPLYKDNLTKRAESVIKAFERVSPPHLEIPFVAGAPKPKPNGTAEEDAIDLNPVKLSRKSPRARREAAYRAWRKVEEWRNKPGDDKFTIRGMEIESLEIDEKDPAKSRLRLLDPTIGIKVDLFAGGAQDDAGVVNLPRLWESLQKSPIKLVGMPVSFAIEKPMTGDGGQQTKDPRSRAWDYLLSGWTRSVETLLEDNGVLQSAPAKQAWIKVEWFLHPSHPTDWSEDFHVGPTHGDLNLGNILLHEKGDGLFPWLIDFDKAADERPVVFDLAKLEIEAYHKIAQELFWELHESGCTKNDDEIRDLVRRFERTLGNKPSGNPGHLWDRFRGRRAVPESLKNRFAGILAYFKQVHKRVEDLGLSRREFLIGRAIYALCCLKFKHLYHAKVHPNAPFPAKILLWKLEALLEEFDLENGIVPESDKLGKCYDDMAASPSPPESAIREVVKTIRCARHEGKAGPLGKVLGNVLGAQSGPFLELGSLPLYSSSTGWERLLRLLRDNQIAGRSHWIRELLWYARDFGLVGSPAELADFTQAMVLASQEPNTSLPEFADLWDYASTGRLGNIYPSLKMFEHLADSGKGPLIKISSRGDSGGTIDILEQAGIPICKSWPAIRRELAQRKWAVVETSEHLCEVDKILMGIRKECHCMKVSDLVMASISAKKVALGIRNFTVQIVSGYDAKFAALIEDNGGSSLKKRWKTAWQKIAPGGKLMPEQALFQSNSLSSWFRGQGGGGMVVFGKALLASNIWKSLSSETKDELIARLPAAFCDEMDDLSQILEDIRKHCSGKKPSEARKGSCDLGTIIDLVQVQAPPHLAGTKCFESGLLASRDGFAEMALVIFQFSRDVRGAIRVDYLDHLFDEISRSGHPMASLIFGTQWLAVLAPRSDLPADLAARCWNVLRDGFDHKQTTS